jgi:hypothetical protein
VDVPAAARPDETESYLPLVGRSKNFEHSEKFFGWGAGARRIDLPTRKMLRIFRPPHKGEVKTSILIISQIPHEAGRVLVADVMDAPAAARPDETESYLPLVGRSKNFEHSEKFFGWGAGADG